MRFCTHCGHRLDRAVPPGDSRERAICGACSSVHYENPKVLVACLVYWRNQIVLCRRAIDPGKGCWYPPTGFVENGESLEEAAVRELSEETGLEVSAGRVTLYGAVSLPHLNEVYVAYRSCLTEEPTLKPGAESLDVRLFAEADIPFDRLAFSDASAGLLRHFFRHLRIGRFPVHSITLGHAMPFG